jgi:hypothetical protein
MSCHGETHNAETEKSDFSHVYNLGLPALDQPRCSWGGRGELFRISKQVPLMTWNAHNKPCAMEGNARVWRAGGVMC